MANLLNPPAIIFINQNISTGALSQIEKQLFITQTIPAVEFDQLVLDDPEYCAKRRGQDQRILVLRDLLDYTNRELADAVLCLRENNLVYIEENKMGPPGKTLNLQNVYLLALMTGS